jgi:hypothetical protein
MVKPQPTVSPGDPEMLPLTGSTVHEIESPYACQQQTITRIVVARAIAFVMLFVLNSSENYCN